MGSYKRKRTIRSYEQFFFDDLSSFLKLIETDMMSSNRSINVVKGVRREIPFRFIIPKGRSSKGSLSTTTSEKSELKDYEYSVIAVSLDFNNLSYFL